MLAMRNLNNLAFLSVARACGFTLLAIVCVMAGAAYDVAISFMSGGLLSLLACCVLLSKASKASITPYKRTEVWVLLDPDDRPKAEIAQQLIGSTLRQLYLRFARNFAMLSVLLFSCTMLMRVLYA